MKMLSRRGRGLLTIGLFVVIGAGILFLAFAVNRLLDEDYRRRSPTTKCEDGMVWYRWSDPPHWRTDSPPRLCRE